MLERGRNPSLLPPTSSHPRRTTDRIPRHSIELLRVVRAPGAVATR